MLRVLIRWFFVVFLGFPLDAVSQCASPEFSVESFACHANGMSFNFLYTPTGNELSWDWDVCDGGALTEPTMLQSAPPGILSGAFDIALVTESGIPVAFVANSSNNTIQRLRFSSGLNSAPETDMVTGVIPGPRGIAVFEKDNVKFAVSSTGGGEIYLLQFGSSFSNTPVVSLIAGGMNDVRHVVIKETETDIYIIAPGNTGGGAGVLTVLAMGNSLTNAVQTRADFSLPALGYFTGIEVIKECENWYAIAGGYTSGLHLLSFGPDLFDQPEVNKIEGVDLPLGMSLHLSAENKYLFLSAGSASLVRVNFGASVNNLQPEVQNISTMGTLSLPIAFTMMAMGNKYYGMAAGFSNNELAIFDFPSLCNSQSNFINVPDPEVEFDFFDGTESYYVSLRVTNKEGDINIFTDTIRSSDFLPASDFSFENICAGANTLFTPVNPEDGSDKSWNFGDGNSGTTSGNAEHLYVSPGVYHASLEVIAPNGCKSSTGKDIKIYSRPDAEFTIPEGPICTNGQLLFENGTLDSHDDLLKYQWYVDDAMIGETRDLNYTFTETGDHAVRLVALIPGCSDESEIVIPQISKGPDVAIETEGLCQYEEILLTSVISEDVLSYEWMLDDVVYTEHTPSHSFSAPGNYPILLTVTSESGCATTVADEIRIFPRPVVDFEISAPSPFCTETPIDFLNTTLDLSDSEIATWKWEFANDSTSAEESPEFTFTEPGTFEINLIATTDAGCADTAMQVMTVYPTPEINITYDQVCVGMPSVFKGTSSVDTRSWEWVIGDKTYRDESFEHRFRTPGTFEITLEAVSSDGCFTNIEKTVVVPAPFEPQFLVDKNCVNETTVFKEITQTEDRVIDWKWTIDGTTLTGNPATTVFDNTGQKTLLLEVHTQSGCTYVGTKTFDVVPFPQADFSIPAEIGSPPLQVEFTNKSVGADFYNWSFGDGSLSEAVSPAYTYTETGKFDVVLSAYNEEGCEDSFSRTITMSPAYPDVNILAVTTADSQDGTKKVTIVLENQGNTILTNLPVDIDISGALNLRETIAGPVYPSSRVNLQLSYGLQITDDVKFLCAYADLEGDRSPELNRNCIQFSGVMEFLPGYPNPVTEFLLIEWVSAGTDNVAASLRNSLGIEVWKLEFTSQKGLNQQRIEVDNLQRGVYMLILEGPGIKTMQRLLLSK